MSYKRTKDCHEQLLELYHQGLSDRKIAEQSNFHTGTISNWRNKHNLPTNFPNCSSNFRDEHKCETCFAKCYWHRIGVIKYKGKMYPRLQKFIDKNWIKYKTNIIKDVEGELSTFSVIECKLHKERKR